MRLALVSGLAVLALASIGAENLSAQVAYPNEQAGYSQISSRTASGVRTTSYERNTGRSNPALNFYGRPKASGYGSHSRSVQAPAPVPVQTKPMGKPFSTYRAQSTITPYLGLDYFEDSVGVPNYFLFVRPQLDQNYVNREQRNDNRALRAGLRQAKAGGAVTRPAGGIPTTGHSTQFMQEGAYYPSLQR